MTSFLQSTNPRFLVIGAGSRGNSYARAVTVATSGSIAAVAEPDAFKRDEFGRKYIWGEGKKPTDGQAFAHWEDWITWETARRKESRQDAEIAITGVFICTLDDTHMEIIHALAPLNLHVLCEKPLALSLSDCLSVSYLSQIDRPAKIFSIGHVLRYSPHNTLLRKLLLQDRVIGDVVSLEHTEPVGWWHFSHSYVRGNWRRSTPEKVGSLLTKSCHDIDFILWLLCSPPPNSGLDTPPHLPSNISSVGALTHFKKSRKPKLAGAATNCLSCPAEPTCNYSAQKIYRDRWLRKERDTGWPLKIVMPEIEDAVSSQGWDVAEDELMKRLAEDYDAASLSDQEISQRSWYGRCVYESDNDVVDDQVVTISWEDDESNLPGRGRKTAVFHMTYPTQAQCERRGRIYGSHGEIWYDSKSISVYTFANESVQVHSLPRLRAEEEKAHGGGDFGLTRSFVQAVQMTDEGQLSAAAAQKLYVGCDLEEIVRSHAVVFAAEEARLNKVVVDFPEWWSRKLAQHKEAASGENGMKIGLGGRNGVKN